MICSHPELVPTRWNQPQPEPCEMVATCRCGENYSCPVCHFGHGAFPCTCEREDMKAWQQLGAEAFWSFEEMLLGPPAEEKPR